jgi:AcrR family transcriptional regulator
MPTATRARAQHLGPDRRRPQVLDAALEIAIADGVGAVTIGSVAERLGVTRPVVYACFAGRVEMLESLLVREGGLLLDAVLAALHSSGDARGPEQSFIRGTQALLATVETHPSTWRLVLVGEPDRALSARFEDARNLVRAEAISWMRPALEHWWEIDDLERKLPVLIELFLAGCEAGLRSMLAADNTWTADELGEFVGRSLYRLFRDA